MKVEGLTLLPEQCGRLENGGIVRQIERSTAEEVECFLRQIETRPLTCKRLLWVIGKATV